MKEIGEIQLSYSSTVAAQSVSLIHNKMVPGPSYVISGFQKSPMSLL